MALSWLMFATIMILLMAMSPYSHSSLPATFSITALTLLLLLGWFERKRREGSLFSPPHFVRGEKRESKKGRASRRLAFTTERQNMTMLGGNGNKNIGQMGEEANQAVLDMVQSGTALAHLKYGGNIADGVFLGCMAALGALTPTAMMLAKRPVLTPEEVREKGNEIATSLVTHETLLFAALASAHIMTDLDRSGGLTTEFGPHILWQALNIWEKVYPDKKADDFFDANMLKAARNVGASIGNKLNDFLAHRSKTSVPPSSTLQ